MNIIEIKDLKKDYPLGATIVPALRGVDLTVAEGDFMSIIGPSGSGKTTLLNIIGCIDLATSGSVKVAGREITALSDRQITEIRLNKIGFIFQTFNLIPVLNVMENIEFPLLLMKRPAAEVRKRAEKLVEEVGLKEHVNHRPSELSGGQRQRVAIARALITNPGIVLADEPTANLDSATAQEILHTFRQLVKQEGRALLIVTHDPQVRAIADRTLFIQDGRLRS